MLGLEEIFLGKKRNYLLISNAYLIKMEFTEQLKKQSFNKKKSRRENKRKRLSIKTVFLKNNKFKKKIYYLNKSKRRRKVKITMFLKNGRTVELYSKRFGMMLNQILLYCNATLLLEELIRLGFIFSFQGILF